MDRGAWRARVHRVTKSQTWLSTQAQFEGHPSSGQESHLFLPDNHLSSLPCSSGHVTKFGPGNQREDLLKAAEKDCLLRELRMVLNAAAAVLGPWGKGQQSQNCPSRAVPPVVYLICPKDPLPYLCFVQRFLPLWLSCTYLSQVFYYLNLNSYVRGTKKQGMCQISKLIWCIDELEVNGEVWRGASEEFWCEEKGD